MNDAFLIVDPCGIDPFLAQPMQRWLTQALQRDVDLSLDGHTPASVRVRLLGPRSTPLDVRWWCPTCERAVGDPEADDLRFV